MRSDHWNRRDFGALLVGAAVIWPLAGRAQPLERMRRIGVLSPLSPSQATSPPFETFRKTLRELNHVEDKDISFAYRWADGSRDRLVEYAAELASMKVDLLFAAPGTPTAIAAQKATTTIPIVFAGVGDAVGTGLVASLARPGGNATGLVNMSQDVAGKQLEVLQEALPGLRRVGVLWRPSNPSYGNLRSRFDAVVRATGVEVVLVGVETRDDLVGAFKSMKEREMGGVLVQADELFINEGARIIALAAAHRLPAIYRLGYQAGEGGLLAYGPNIPDMYRRAAHYVDRILRGGKPSELPIEQPTRIELVVNLRTAKALGLTIPQALLVRADEIVE
jgi:putative tryptophan/tyrosine transport system substrate-binding protein